jgi:hypothetical protein
MAATADDVRGFGFAFTVRTAIIAAFFCSASATGMSALLGGVHAFLNAL